MFQLEECAQHARAGRLTVAGRSLETPGLLLYCKRGHPLNLTPDTAALNKLSTGRVLDATEL